MISIGLLRGTFGPAEAGRRFSGLAECLVRALFMRTLEEFERQHGRLPGGAAALLAFGRLGSCEMTFGSDLDLIVIYDHAPEAAASDGARPLPPSQYYTRLTQRLTAALAAPTAEGIAYAVDLRLRPSGRSGPLATYIEAFEHYQLKDAWTWEHMAMSRGRDIAGDGELRQRVSAVLDRLAAAPRDEKALSTDVASMRGRIEREKAAVNPFDVKHAQGGLVDCEFAAQYLVLAGLGRVAGETTLETLQRGIAAGKLAAEEGATLVASLALQTAILQVLRIAEARAFDPDHAPDALKRLLVSSGEAALRAVGADPGLDFFEALRERLGGLQARTRIAFEAVVGRPVG